MVFKKNLLLFVALLSGSPLSQAALKIFENTTPGLSASFVKIESGTFLMGSPYSEIIRDSDETQHQVTLTRDFEMQTTDVTQLQWFLVMGDNPSYFKDAIYCQGDHVEINKVSLCPYNPVEQVSWNDTQDFIVKLNQSGDGYTYRLPTEAEWEYSARAGSQAAYSFGDDVSKLGDYAWFAGNSDQTHAVGTKIANAFGLYDMHGNVWQWVQDRYGDYPSEPQIDPTGSSTGKGRVFRGGSWVFNAWEQRSANRQFFSPLHRSDLVGFRLVRTRSP